ncbi:MAG TPA: inositol 2-dehydrogenase [Steroidobacteraceae bacterium]|jgi:myo-inositol 2-dehydrogenase/D-chiro-inositol 1-dehydrogenase|nr:inositol 2-dehydrogenase [Steroidobacteraceae bacterium]
MYNVAIFGAGRIGQIHARNAAYSAELKLKFVVDPNRAAAAALASQTGAIVADVDAVLGDGSIHGVIIASATNVHLDQALAAASAGKAIFCEKPLDLDLARARQAGAQLAGAKMLVGFNRRFDPHFNALKARIESNAIGKLESVNITSHDPAPPPVAYIRVSGGLFKDMTIHDFDMARWLLNEEPIEVFASASCLVDPEIGAAGDVDTARILLRTGTGRLCSISNTRRSGYGYDQRIEAYGSAGAARADNVLESTVWTCTERGSASDALQYFFLERYREAYRRELQHFADILRHGTAPAAGYRDGVAALVLAEAAALSVKLNKPVNISSI